MTDAAVVTARHVFISYARDDRAAAEDIRARLTAGGIPTWIDDVALEPGTPDWQASIRAAIQDAAAVIVLCSPKTVSARFVEAEIVLAQSFQRPIIPVWIDGPAWANVAPLTLLTYQYVDGRNERSTVLGDLVRRLKALLAKHIPPMLLVDDLERCPFGYVPVLLGAGDHSSLDLYEAGRFVDTEIRFGRSHSNDLQFLAVDASRYDSLERMLDDLYTGFLREQFAPYTYGRDWMLVKASIYVTVLAVRWEWLRNKRGMLLVDAIPDYVQSATPLQSFGFGMHVLGDKSIWAVVTDQFADAVGLFTSNDNVVRQAFEPMTKSLTFTLDRCDRHLNLDVPPENAKTTGVYRLATAAKLKFSNRLVIVRRPFLHVDLPDDAVYIIYDTPANDY